MIVPQRGNRAYEHEILYAFSIFYAFVPPIVVVVVFVIGTKGKFCSKGCEFLLWILLNYVDRIEETMIAES